MRSASKKPSAAAFLLSKAFPLACEGPSARPCARGSNLYFGASVAATRAPRLETLPPGSAYAPPPCRRRFAHPPPDLVLLCEAFARGEWLTLLRAATAPRVEGDAHSAAHDNNVEACRSQRKPGCSPRPSWRAFCRKPGLDRGAARAFDRSYSR